MTFSGPDTLIYSTSDCGNLRLQLTAPSHQQSTGVIPSTVCIVRLCIALLGGAIAIAVAAMRQTVETQRF